MSFKDPTDKWPMRHRLKIHLSMQRYFSGQRVKYGVRPGSDDEVLVISTWEPERKTLYMSVADRARRQLLPISETDPRKH